MNSKKRALVIGGGGEIGKAIVAAFVSRGFHVDATFTEESDASTLASGDGFVLDVTKSERVTEFFDRYLDENELDALVYNAGANRSALVVSMTDEDWNHVISVNLNGAFFVTRSVLPHFLARKSGRIVLMSSLSRSGAAGSAAYSASKAGLVGLSGTIAKEYGSKGVRCNVVAPGFVESGMTAELPAQLREFWESNCPTRRFCTPAEVAGPIVQLCGDDFTFVNGAVIPITGGLEWLP
ncbi:MAG: SDR family oxidoreductase [Bdellovibrionota bacterium]